MRFASQAGPVCATGSLDLGMLPLRRIVAELADAGPPLDGQLLLAQHSCQLAQCLVERDLLGRPGFHAVGDRGQDRESIAAEQPALGRGDHAQGEVGDRAPGGNAMLEGLAQEREVAARAFLDQVGESGVQSPARRRWDIRPRGLSDKVVSRSQQPEDDGAMGNREAAFACVIQSMWGPDSGAGDANREWVRSAWQALKPYSTGGTYVNFQTDDEADERTVESYRNNYERLGSIKRRTTHPTCSV